MTRTISVARDGAVATLTLDRPQVRNALNPGMIADIRTGFEKLSSDPAVRIVVLRGAGAAFCAGGDLNWMRDVLGQTEAEVTADSRNLLDMYRTIDTCPKLVIAQVHGAAYAGAMGILACCDVVIARRDTRFCLSEIRIGLVPGIVAAFLVPRIGTHRFRYLAASAITFDGEAALAAGLVHEIAEDDSELDARTKAHVELGLQSSPDAIAKTGELIRALGGPDRSMLDTGLAWNARARLSDEAQEGISAFLNKRKPAWQDRELAGGSGRSR